MNFANIYHVMFSAQGQCFLEPPAMEHALSLLDALALEHGVAEIALPAPARDPEEPAPKCKKTSKAPNKARPTPSAKPSEILQPTSKSTPLHSPLVVECTLTRTPSFDSEDELPEPVVKMHKLSVPPWRNSSPPTACRPPVSCPKPIGAPVDLRPSVAPSRPSSSSHPTGSKAAPIGAPMLPPEDRPVPLLPPRSLGPTQPARPPPATMLPISHTLRVIGAASPQTKHLVVPKHVAAAATTDVFAAAFGDGFLPTPHLLRPKAAIVPPPSQAKSWCEGAAAVSRPPPPPPAVLPSQQGDATTSSLWFRPMSKKMPKAMPPGGARTNWEKQYRIAKDKSEQACLAFAEQWPQPNSRHENDIFSELFQRATIMSLPLGNSNLYKGLASVLQEYKREIVRDNFAQQLRNSRVD